MADKIVRQRVKIKHTPYDHVMWRDIRGTEHNTESAADAADKFTLKFRAIESKEADDWVRELGFDRFYGGVGENYYEDGADTFLWVKFKNVGEIKLFCKYHIITIKKAEQKLCREAESIDVGAILKMPVNEWILLQYCNCLDCAQGWIMGYTREDEFKKLLAKYIQKVPFNIKI